MEKLVTMIYFNEEYMNPLFEILEKCKGVEQSPKWHPEGDVYIHSLQVFRLACRESDDVDLILAALLHDVGKAVDGLEHTKKTLDLIDQYVSSKTIFLVKHHMRIWAYIHGEMKKWKKCKDLVEHPWFPELVQLARWVNMGRVVNCTLKYTRQDIIDKLNKAVKDHWSGEAPYPLKEVNV
ncbi:Multifunctional CCA protein [subsurface metagenome]